MQNLGSLGNNYLIKRVISKDGQFSEVFLVEHKKTHQLFAGKVNESEGSKEYILNEKYIFEHLPNHSNIVRFIEYGEGELIENKKEPINKSYIILEYCSKKTLTYYTFLFEKGFDEKYAKFIFKKIILAVQNIHNSKIAHLDLKTCNILLDEKYNLKICDFGVSVREQGKIKIEKLKIITGTKGYKSPQVEDYKEFKVSKNGYNGYKNDIYSLGIILFNLLTGKMPFLNYSEYKKKIENLNLFLDKESKSINIDFSPSFRALFTKLISKFENDRLTIEQILKSPWLEEINNLNNEELLQLENDLIKEYQRRERKIEESNTQNINSKKKESNNSSENRGVSEECSVHLFLKDDKILKITKNYYFENYINIKGKMIPYDFMNRLTELIKKKCNYLLDKNKQLLELLLIKKEDKEEEENEDDNEEENDEENEENEEEETNGLKFMNPEELKIKISLYQKSEEDYLLNFEKLSGDWMEYYKSLKIISSFPKELLEK